MPASSRSISQWPEISSMKSNLWKWRRYSWKTRSSSTILWWNPAPMKGWPSTRSSNPRRPGGTWRTFWSRMTRLTPCQISSARTSKLRLKNRPNWKRMRLGKKGRRYGTNRFKRANKTPTSTKNLTRAFITTRKGAAANLFRSLPRGYKVEAPKKQKMPKPVAPTPKTSYSQTKCKNRRSKSKGKVNFMRRSMRMWVLLVLTERRFISWSRDFTKKGTSCVIWTFLICRGCCGISPSGQHSLPASNSTWCRNWRSKNCSRHNFRQKSQICVWMRSFLIGFWGIPVNWSTMWTLLEQVRVRRLFFIIFWTVLSIWLT